MHIILIPDSFKGTFSSEQVIHYIREGFEHHFDDVTFDEVPIADGGEGTVDSIVSALRGEKHLALVRDSLGRLIEASFGMCGRTAIIEMAESSGITKISSKERMPLLTSTYGVGEMILEVLKHDTDEIIIGIGGSATNDGGTGMLQALGVRFFDESGEILEQGGQILKRIRRIDASGIPEELKKIPITVMCDVSNPLTGPKGATMIYGPQKGANDKTLLELEAGMVNYKKILLETVGIDVDLIDGAGAAGGLGAALVSFLGAKLKPGIEVILDLVSFDSMVSNADLVITGEGKIDAQSIYGKVPVGVAGRCLDFNVEVIALVGTEGDQSKVVYDHGINAIVSTIAGVISEEDLTLNAEKRIKESIENLCRLLKIGMKLNK
ncbi:glycerate kinase [Fusibacter bizertensis]|uniref:Glycerate kinase n=1 Tax=Fusibacter bizertensis TaxID=1488331 RepID=A0ABT6NCD5_9FIRM|nr:glycerate kinase [Fusibacter bizertensis]MDH8678077.1 glycerate kinase [Fusibacter bizertensis]